MPHLYDPRPGNGSLTVTWFIRDDHSPYGGFDVQYREEGTTSWANAGHSGPNLSHTVSSLTNGTKYEVQAQATNSAGAGPWPGIEEGTPVGPPAAPTNVTVGPASE